MNVEGHRVVLDANVLVPELLRDLLLRMAQQGLYEVRWSEQILDELYRTLTGDNFTTEARAARTMQRMRGYFTDAPVTGYEPLIDRMTNDPKDRHVLAAAVHARADALVTFNLRHFPAASLAPHGRRVLSPDAFLTERLDATPDALLAALRRMERERVRPQRTAPEILAALARLAPRFAAATRPRLAPSLSPLVPACPRLSPPYDTSLPLHRAYCFMDAHATVSDLSETRPRCRDGSGG